MAVRIVYSEIAKENLYEIYKFISRDSVYYARKEINLIRSSIKALKTNSYRCKVFEDLDDYLIRELVFKNYRIIYEIVPKEQINIITIHHHARSISNNKAFDSEE